MKRLKLLCLALLPIIVLFIFGACSRRGDNQGEPAQVDPGFDLEVREQIEEQPLNPSDLLAVHFIDVGQGDAILLIQGDYAMLVDSGPPEMGTTVFTYIRDLGITRLTYVVNTHPFADHVGGLADVVRRMDVDYALIPMLHHSTPDNYAFLDTLYEVGQVIVPIADVEGLNAFMLGDAKIEILSPLATDSWERQIANVSIVMRVVFGDTSFLLMGDAMREIEYRLLDSPINLLSDVLKVGRHGSATSTTSAFLEAVSPSIAIISVGQEEGWLSNEVLGRLDGIHTFRTDIHGNIVITSDGTRLNVVVDSSGGG